MSMTQPLSGDNSVLGIRGIGVDGQWFFQFDQMKRALSSKERFPELRAVRGLGMNSLFDLCSLAFCPADNATGNARAGVAGWLGFEIVRFRVDYHRAPNHRALVIRERDLMVHIFQRRLA
jgi:hypothetical protein